MQILRKLTLNAIGFEKEVLRNMCASEPDKDHEIAKFNANIEDHEEVTTDHGVSFRFVGEFVMQNTITGESYFSNQAFFPKIIEELSRNMEGNLAGTITVKYKQNAATGYVYGFKPYQIPETVTKMLPGLEG